MDRYAGKPFLKLVDSFVLDCIGELDPSQATALVKMTPNLQATFSANGTWQEIVMSQLQFEPAAIGAIHDLWTKNQSIAKDAGTVLEPMKFVEMFVASNVTGA